MSDLANNKPTQFTFKRCPYCYTNLKLTAEHCIECRKPIGEIDQFGMAKKPVNWKAYLAAALWIILLSFYTWKILFVKFMAEFK